MALCKLCDRCGQRLDGEFDAHQQSVLVRIEFQSVNREQGINAAMDIDCCIACAHHLYNEITAFQQYLAMVNSTLPKIEATVAEG